MINSRYEKMIKVIHPRLQVAFLFAVFFVILGILDMILDFLLPCII